jgi:hypothetical protein
MIIKAYYPGRVDVFDTDHFTEALPCKGNLLTNYALDVSPALKGQSILLRAFWHESAESYRDVTDDDGLPIARRRDGWSFLLADPIDIADLCRLTVDGELVLERMGKKLVDAAALMRVYDEAEDLGPRAVAAHAYLEALMGDFGFENPEDVICWKMGMSSKCYQSVEAVQASMSASRLQNRESWSD